MVKKIIFFLFISCSLFSQTWLNKNDKATFDGFLISKDKVEQFKQTEDLLKIEIEKSEQKDILILKFEEQIKVYETLKIEYETKINLLNMKNQIQADLSSLYKERSDNYNKLEFQLNIYKTTTYVMIGISLASIIGISGYILGNYIQGLNK